jgi:hypothetical protein
MQRLAWLFFVLCLAVAAAYIVATTGALPEQVASHFGRGNAANAYMTRGGYLAFMLVFAVALPAFLAAMIGLLPRRWPNAINLPHKDYWLDPKRRDATLNALSGFGASLGSLTVLFTAAIHYVLIVANRSSPPQLPADLFFALLAVLVAAITLWAAALWLRFRNRD